MSQKSKGMEAESLPAAGLSWLPRVFVVFALVLVSFWTLVFSTYVIHRTYIAGGDAASNAIRLESIWAWLLIASIGWGLLNLYWSLSSLRKRDIKTYLSHWLLALACGLIVLGIQGVLIARSLTITPIVIDHSVPNDPTKKQEPAVKPVTVAVAGDAAKGQAVFSKTCITCHGPTGQGMPNLAPSLVGSSFIASADDSAVANVIRMGRALGDPQNKSGKVMPARGGNPFLSEEDIVHLAAFVRAIQSKPIASSGDSGAASVQLAAWVVPDAKRPKLGLNLRVVNQERTGGLKGAELANERRSRLFLGLTIGLTIVHGLFMAGVIAISSNLVLPTLLTGRAEGSPGLIRLSVFGWLLAAVGWLMIAWLCFWWR